MLKRHVKNKGVNWEDKGCIYFTQSKKHDDSTIGMLNIVIAVIAIVYYSYKN